MKYTRRIVSLVLLLVLVFSMSANVAYAKTTHKYTVEPKHNTKLCVSTGIFGGTLTLKNNGGSRVTVFVKKIPKHFWETQWSQSKIVGGGKTISFKLSTGSRMYNVTMWLTDSNGKKTTITLTI